MPVTQKQIAQSLGVSRELVKFALSGNGRVSEPTRRKIVLEAQRLGYHSGSNREARSLIARRYGKRLRQDIIAVLTQSRRFEGTSIQNVPFFEPFLDGLEDAASAREVDIFYCSFHADRLPRLIQDEAVDGVVCLATGSNDLFNLALPIVTVGARHPATFSLLPDDAEGARLATQHLIELGHRRIAYLGFDPPGDYSPATDRYHGYCQALREAGLPQDSTRVGVAEGSLTPEGGARALEALWLRGADFSGLVCFNDLMAMGAIQALRARGYSVPEDVSVVGFDDVTDHYAFEPKLTSIHFDREVMGRRACEWIYNQVEATAATASLPDAQLFPVHLVVRHSTGPYTHHLHPPSHQAAGNVAPFNHE